MKKIALKVLPREIRMKLRSANKRKFLLEQMPKNSVCAEIGVFEGDFSEQILKIVKPKKLYLIDPWPKEESKWEKKYLKVLNRFQSEIKDGRVVVFRYFSHDVIEKFDDDFFDWIYLDGGHSHDNLIEQFSDYFPKIKSNGFVTGDDYGRDNVTVYGDEVTRAVDEFISKKVTKTILIKNNQFILKKTKPSS